VFDDLAALRQEQSAAAPRRRQRTTETFARVPHDRALALYRRIGGPAWVLLVELDRLILKGRGRNPVTLSSPQLKAIGFSRHSRRSALRQLEQAEVVRTEQCGNGRRPKVFHTWYPRQD
jgi:hypothetical protein